MLALEAISASRVLGYPWPGCLQGLCTLGFSGTRASSQCQWCSSPRAAAGFAAASRSENVMDTSEEHVGNGLFGTATVLLYVISDTRLRRRCLEKKPHLDSSQYLSQGFSEETVLVTARRSGQAAGRSAGGLRQRPWPVTHRTSGKAVSWAAHPGTAVKERSAMVLEPRQLRLAVHGPVDGAERGGGAAAACVRPRSTRTPRLLCERRELDP